MQECAGCSAGASGAAGPRSQYAHCAARHTLGDSTSGAESTLLATVGGAVGVAAVGHSAGTPASTKGCHGPPYTAAGVGAVPPPRPIADFDAKLRECDGGGGWLYLGISLQLTHTRERIAPHPPKQ